MHQRSLRSTRQANHHDLNAYGTKKILEGCQTFKQNKFEKFELDSTIYCVISIQLSLAEVLQSQPPEEWRIKIKITIKF